MHYDPVPPVENIFNKVEDLINYRDMENCPYSHPQSKSKVYNNINKTRNFRKSIKSWNCLHLIQKTWIAFKTHFREVNLLLTKNVYLNWEQAGYGQANLVEDIVSRFNAKFQHHRNM